MTGSKRYNLIALILSLCVLLETLSQTYMQENGGTFYYSSSILYLLSGLAVCIIPFIPATDVPVQLSVGSSWRRGLPYLMGVFISFLGIYHIVRLTDLYRQMAIDLRWADMLPSLQVACTRFLHGETVYAPIPQFYKGSIMPYLPAMWMPFLPAAIFNFDFRWITVFFQLLGVAVIAIPAIRSKRSIPVAPLVIGAVSLFLFHNYFLYKRYDYWGMTEEGVVACFYLLLGFALLRRNYWLIGLAITACALSRYSLLVWLPVYYLYVLFTQSRWDFAKLLISSGVSMLGLFIIPFFICDPHYFMHIPDSYLTLTEQFWRVHEIADHKLYNIGLFKFFTVDQTHTMFILEFATSFLAPVILILVVKWLSRNTAVKTRYIGLASLKISLIFFFAFIQLPYVYVFVPVTLLSYVILFDYLAGHGIEATT